MKRASRKPSNLSDSLHQRLNSYALAASAAGVGMLALAQPSEAKIVYTKTRVVIGHGGVQLYHLDLNNDGDAAFSISTTPHYWKTQSSHHVGFSVRLIASGALGSNGVAGGSRSGSYASALKRGARIGSTLTFQGRDMGRIFQMTGNYWSAGWCRVVGPRYLGLKFMIDEKTHYGWARFDVRCHMGSFGESTITGTLTGYAYETIPNKPIITGKTKGPDVITIEPASLGALAAGANGLHTWRQK